MDKATLVGLVGGLAIVTWSIWAAGSTFGTFWDRPSIVLVVGGTLMAAFTAFPFRTLRALPRIVSRALFPTIPAVEPVIRQLVGFAEAARRDGLLSLEPQLEKIKDPFLKLGLQLAIDGTDSAITEGILRTEMESLAARHKVGRSIVESLNKSAPAWGMIGTLLGLVIMLGNMNDPNSIGPGMAVALLTTFYGAVLSNMIFAPIAEKLALLSRQELEIREITLRGLLSIQLGDNPRLLEQKLRIFQEPAERHIRRARAA